MTRPACWPLLMKVFDRDDVVVAVAARRGAYRLEVAAHSWLSHGDGGDASAGASAGASARGHAEGAVQSDRLAVQISILKNLDGQLGEFPRRTEPRRDLLPRRPMMPEPGPASGRAKACRKCRARSCRPESGGWARSRAATKVRPINPGFGQCVPGLTDLSFVSCNGGCQHNSATFALDRLVARHGGGNQPKHVEAAHQVQPDYRPHIPQATRGYPLYQRRAPLRLCPRSARKREGCRS